MPSPAEPEVAIGTPPEEDWSQPGPESYPLVLENSVLRTEWSVRGASCGRVLLKQYLDHRIEGEPRPEDYLVLHDSARVQGKNPSGGIVYRKRDAFRLTETSDVLLPADPETRVKPNLDGVEWEVEEDLSQNQLSFRWTAPNGVQVLKVVRLAENSYHFEAEVTVIAPTDPGELLGRDIALRIGTGGGIQVTVDPYYQNPWAAVGLTAHGALDDVDFFHPRGTLPPSRAVAKRWSGSIPMIAEGSKYFINAIHALERDFDGAVAEVLFDDAAFIAAAPGSAAGATIRRNPSDLDYWSRTSIGGDFTLRLHAASTSERRSFRWYVGPKDSSIMDKAIYGPLSELPDAADYSTSWFYKIFLTPYVAPVILTLLKFFQSIVGNWGVAIILLTVLVRVLVFPITRHSQVKMAEYSTKMQKVKPMLEAVNQKYANDKEKKQMETMKIYKQHKLTPPVGGCLPIFLQMPVFIGLFAALRSSIDLRLKPFTLWIQDLSVPDRFIDLGHPLVDVMLLRSITSLNILPLLMVVLWIIHQRSMPKPTDPQQLQMYKIMAFMPVMFGLLLYNYASGLSLYMITSSALGIFEQKVIRKHWPVAPPAATGTVLSPPGKARS
ncbi:MAG: membrane protein insertase YidC [Planctomycetota bacterium]|nr:membrane protein insertase YidC [Planctomycetota bacterium]